MLLGLSRIEAQAPATLRSEVLIQDVVRASLEDVRRIAIELRPEALADLGLASALAVLAQRLSERLGLEVSEYIAPDLPDLPAESELVVYRVAQEALTDAARHFGSDRAVLPLAHRGNVLTLTVRDEGRGVSPGFEAGTGDARHARARRAARRDARDPQPGLPCRVRGAPRRSAGGSRVTAEDPDPACGRSRGRA
ncbi:MAG: sensor histidine kinase [Solirubrobacteraceae bacterium]